MSVSEWAIVAAGIAAIVWINWYFFFAGRRSVTATAAGAVQEVTIAVKGGYSPDTVELTQGRRARLVFDRQERSGCSEEVVFPEFGIRKYLPPFQKTVVEFTPPAPGVFEFTCGMSMLRGRVVVK